MKEGIEQLNVLFQNRATTVFFALYNEFRHSTALIDRQGDENVFQKLQNRYVSQLALQLHDIALEVLEKADHSHDRQKLQYAFTHSIEEYTNEFLQKIKSH
jgi:hypothetical protein